MRNITMHITPISCTGSPTQCNRYNWASKNHTTLEEPNCILSQNKKVIFKVLSFVFFISFHISCFVFPAWCKSKGSAYWCDKFVSECLPQSQHVNVPAFRTPTWTPLLSKGPLLEQCYILSIINVTSNTSFLQSPRELSQIIHVFWFHWTGRQTVCVIWFRIWVE